MTKQAKDMNGHFTTPCEEFTKSQDQEDAQLIQRIEPNSTIGLIILVRALEFESLYGLDFLVTGTTDPTLTVWLTACLARSSSASKTVFW